MQTLKIKFKGKSKNLNMFLQALIYTYGGKTKIKDITTEGAIICIC